MNVALQDTSYQEVRDVPPAAWSRHAITRENALNYTLKRGLEERMDFRKKPGITK